MTTNSNSEKVVFHRTMNGFIKILFAIFFAFVTVTETVPQNVDLVMRAPGLNSQLLAPRAADKDPTISMACFMNYIEGSTQVGERYSKDYNECMWNATAIRQKIDEQMLLNREIIEKTAEGVCMRLQRCNEYNNTLEMFHCHENLGADNTKVTYGITGNATEFATLLQERYRLIDLQHEQCCKEAERVYVADTAKSFNQLQNCLRGNGQPNTTTSTTSTTTSTTSATTTSAAATTTSESTPMMTTIGPWGAITTTLEPGFFELLQQLQQQQERERRRQRNLRQ